MRSAIAIALAAVALVGSCGFERPDRIDMDATLPTDAPPSGMRLSGGITVIGGISTADTLKLVDDGVEGFDRSCAGTLCVTGFLGP